MSIITTEIITIGDLLQNSNLYIPPFQRPYKWTVRNVVQLLDDIQRFKGTTSYRIGTIVVYQDGEKLNIVDGQQRTISFLLILRAMIAYKFDELEDPALKERLSIVKSRAFSPGFTSDISKKNIQDNYREIERRMDSIEGTYIDFFINRCELAYFVIDDISEAFQFFDSQNARGKDLEPHDLLKAFHLRELDNSASGNGEHDTASLVKAWEDMNTSELSTLFADFLFRVRGWSKGNSSRYFTKENTPLFKGINLSRIDDYPYTQIYKMTASHIQEGVNKASFPFQLDQVIINGRYFFEMIAHYQSVYKRIKENFADLSPETQNIMQTLDRYDGRNRTGDKYVRMLFNCALLYYIDKFGETDLSRAIQKLFIWAYTPRLNYQNLQLATIDNYVIKDLNLFKSIREALFKEEILVVKLPLIGEDFESGKTAEIKTLFKKLNYYADAKGDNKDI